ncbi:hypothetical protein DC522_03120 [Microvirga sp. KLBC 81]|uniref:hypothetical protein n=1 Tax=Microvirga sp. KLBC 81 TaxID=1862707 RepID=UPI000D51A486|nr:hypothetical protein [Microvirga sp. KLBC 81]PVE25778.1 hypothetical protein DC522_03120 [Microvirga sp. KLBC 81]
METIRAFADYLEKRIGSVPTNRWVIEYYSRNRTPNFSEVVGLWTTFYLFVQPIADLYTARGSALQYTIAHNFYVFFNNNGNRFETTVRRLQEAYKTGGDLIAYEEYREEHLRILALIVEANRSYVVVKAALRNLLLYVRRHGGDLNTILEKPIDTKVFASLSASYSLIGKPDGDPKIQARLIQSIGNTRRARLSDEAPVYKVLGVLTKMAQLGAEPGGLDRSVIFTEYRPATNRTSEQDKDDDGLDLPWDMEIDPERGGIKIPIDEDWGLIIGGDLETLELNISAVFDVDWDVAIEAAIEAILQAVNDAFDCY